MDSFVTITGHRNILKKDLSRITRAFEQILEAELGVGYVGSIAKKI